MKTTNKNSSDRVSRKLKFVASNLSGDWQGNKYVVNSYGWYPLFVFDEETGTWYENKDKYSVSTSKQKSQCSPTGVTTVGMTHKEIKAIVA